jgi:hypothetical protein
MREMSSLVLLIFTIMALNCPNQAMRGMGKGDVLNRKISIWRFSPRLLVGYSERTGNIDLYTRERSYVRLGMTAEF